MFALLNNLPDMIQPQLQQPIVPTQVTTNFFDPTTWSISQRLSDIVAPLKTIAEFLNYILHPSLLLHTLWGWTLQLSFIICLLVCMAATILYIFGHKKYAKLAPASIAVYTLIQAIGSALK